MKMFNKRELEVIKWALYGELKRSKTFRDGKIGTGGDWRAWHNICYQLQLLLKKTIKILAGTEVL